MHSPCCFGVSSAFAIFQDVFFVLLLILNWGAFQNTHFVFKRASSWCVLCVVLVFLCVFAIFKLLLCGHLLLVWGAIQNTHFVLKSSGSHVMWSSCCLSLLLSRPLFLVLIPFECVHLSSCFFIYHLLSFMVLLSYPTSCAESSFPRSCDRKLSLLELEVWDVDAWNSPPPTGRSWITSPW